MVARWSVERRTKGGFTLVEVVIAAGLLAVFGVAAARPIQQAALSAALSGDRIAATHIGVSGLEAARALSASGLSGMSTNTSNYTDAARGMTYRRTLSKGVQQSIGGTNVLWWVKVEVRPVLTGPYEADGQEVKRLPTMLRPVTIYTLQSKWLSGI